MKTMWNNIPCNHKLEKVEEARWTDFIHMYDFGLFDFAEAARRFSGFSFEAKKVMGKIKEGIAIGYGFTGGQSDQLHFKAMREGDKVHITMKERERRYKKIKSKMIKHKKGKQ